MERVEQAIAAIFEAAVRLGGTLSGEHGIGLSKRPFLRMALSPETIRLMENIKRAVDPKNILNPGKIWGRA
jgi:glycolate oxidase